MACRWSSARNGARSGLGGSAGLGGRLRGRRWEQWRRRDMLSMGALSCAALQLAVGYRCRRVASFGRRQSLSRSQPRSPRSLRHSDTAAAALDGMTLAEAHKTLTLPADGVNGIARRHGSSFLLSGQFAVNDIFGGARLQPDVVAGAALAFPGTIGAANAGRVWGPVSDRVGISNTLRSLGSSVCRRCSPSLRPRWWSDPESHSRYLGPRPSRRLVSSPASPSSAHRP